MTNNTNSFQPDEKHPIQFTPKAIEITKQVINDEGEPNDNVRVAIVGGGCSGFQYSMDFEKNKRDDDVVIEYDGLTVYIDPISLQYLYGTTIDYISDENGSGFKFFNPNPPRRTCSGCCSCG